LAIKTTLAQLEEVQAAITKTLAALDSSIGDKRLLRNKISALTDRETILLARYRAETGTGGIAINQGIRRRD
jgi:hypothetical protein